MLRRGLAASLSVTATNASRSPNFHGRWHRKRLRTRSPPSGGHRFLIDVALSNFRQRGRQKGGKVGRATLRGAFIRELRFALEPDRNLFLALDLNETLRAALQIAV